MSSGPFPIVLAPPRAGNLIGGIIWTDARGQQRKTVVNALNLYRSGFRYQPRQSVVEAADSRIGVFQDWALPAR